jgi:hypothetical protein
VGLAPFNAVEEELKFLQNRKKYKKEAKSITTWSRFKRFNQIIIKAGDPILTTPYPVYYMQIIDKGESR